METKNKTAPILWSPSPARLTNSQLTRYTHYVEGITGEKFNDYFDLWHWSVDSADTFWESLWDFFGIIGESKSQTTKIDPSNFFKSYFFSGSRLNYTENILAGVPADDTIRIIYNIEGQNQPGRTGRQLHQNVHALACGMRNIGLTKEDRVAGYLPNSPETIEACLGSAGLGAIWTSTSPDFGIQGVLDRFSQVEPAILFCTDRYIYKGKSISILDKLDKIIKNLPSLRKVIVVNESKHPDTQAWINQYDGVSIEYYDDFITSYQSQRLTWQRFSFDHPLFILYSSGTTGKPKCIVHGTGGTLLQHRKEHVLHSDITNQDTVFYFTTCGWMMWNWLVSALGTGCRVVLFDGAPFYPDPGVLWDVAEKSQVTFFGTSAKYLSSLAKIEYHPREKHNLAIKTIASTGSPLLPEQFDFVYDHIESDCHLASISGGTDIISCFVLGIPTLPVRKGEIQGPGLGMAVDVYENDTSIPFGKGELVCRQAFVSRPICFWDDPSNEKYHKAYFPSGPHCWRHGDFIERGPSGGFVIHGRSDTTLNPGGVRIGTAEIYRQVDTFAEVEQALAVSQSWQGDVRIILFVQLANNIVLTEDLQQKICHRLRAECTPRHVPAKIIAAPDLPMTRTGKLSEKAVFDIINGHTSQNRDALANPDSLDFFAKLNISDN